MQRGNHKGLMCTVYNIDPDIRCSSRNNDVESTPLMVLNLESFPISSNHSVSHPISHQIIHQFISVLL